MTDGELIASAVTIAGGGVGATLKWAVGRITKTLDDNTASNNKDADAKVTLAEKLGAFGAKVDAIAGWIERHPTPVRGVPITKAPIHQPDPGPTPRAATQPGGSYRIDRPFGDPKRRG